MTIRLARSIHSAVAALAVAVLLAACGSATGGGSDPADGSPVPITSRAVAVIVMRHQGEDPERAWALVYGSDDPSDQGPVGLVGAGLDYPQASGLDYAISASVIPKATAETHPEAGRCGEFATCVDLPDGVTLAWEKVQAEEDPGQFWVSRSNDQEVAYVKLSGPGITADPRTLDLGGITVDDLIAILQDPDFHLQTSSTLVSQGEKLKHFREDSFE